MILIRYIMGWVRIILLLAFWLSPLGWAYLLAHLYLSIVDAIAPPEDEGPDVTKLKPAKVNDPASLILPIFALSRLFSSGSSTRE